MKPFSCCLTLLGAATLLAAQAPRLGTLMVPASSRETAADVGVRAHTHVMVIASKGEAAGGQPFEAPPFPGYAYETPASLACVYALVPERPAGCNPNATRENPRGGQRVIVLVDAYDDPAAASDLGLFSAQFGLPAPDFSVVFSAGTRPAMDPTGGWELEESLDIEWAHALAPDARIVLMETPSNMDADLFAGVRLAGQIATRAGGGEVNMSWGGSEFLGENALDASMTAPKALYFAAAGDSSGVEYPSASPLVVAAGGTSVNRDPATGDFLFESVWQDTGGGPSAYEPRPFYQNAIAAIVGPSRGVPDGSFDANPSTGVWVYDSTPLDGDSGWFVVGGTSVASVGLAGITNASGAAQASTLAQHALIYQNLGSRYFRDIAYGNCGPYGGFFGQTGWDFCTGVGSPLNLGGQ